MHKIILMIIITIVETVVAVYMINMVELQINHKYVELDSHQQVLIVEKDIKDVFLKINVSQCYFLPSLFP